LVPLANFFFPVAISAFSGDKKKQQQYICVFINIQGNDNVGQADLAIY
jgi:hypothetical protein